MTPTQEKAELRLGPGRGLKIFETSWAQEFLKPPSSSSVQSHTLLLERVGVGMVSLANRKVMGNTNPSNVGQVDLEPSGCSSPSQTKTTKKTNKPVLVSQRLTLQLERQF